MAIEVVVTEFPDSQPGQFVQLQCSSAHDSAPRVASWSVGGFPSLVGGNAWAAREAFLRRPFSIADRWRDATGKTHVLVISRTVGPATAWLERLQAGDTLSITGPLGRGFEVPSTDVPKVLVGGGVGIPPLLYLARRLNELEHRDVTAMFGATTRELLPLRLVTEPAGDGQPTPCVDWPGAARYPAAITSDDGSVGLRGVVTDALERWAARRRGDPRQPDAVVFACGPEAMLRSVAQITRDLALRCQLCIERNMGCGLGTCLSCVVRVRDESRSEGWCWALACTDGPVFDREQLVEYAAGDCGGQRT